MCAIYNWNGYTFKKPKIGPVMSAHNFDFALHHVGGRSATTSFPKVPKFFELNLVRVLYDADESCIEQVKSECERMYSKYFILPFCLSNTEGEEPFYLHQDRYASSLIRPETSSKPLFAENSQFGWDLDMHNVDVVQNVDVTTLDKLLLGNPKLQHVPLPDYLSLDVESAEPKILAGSEKILKNKCIVIQCEFDLEKTFPELNQIFKKFQFEISDINLFPESFKYTRQIPLGLKLSKRRCTFGEIMVFKTPEAIVAHHEDPLTDLIKAAFLSLVMFDLEKTYGYLDKIATFPNSDSFMKAHADIQYFKFMSVFINSIKSYPQILSPKFSTVYPTEDARRERFKDSLQSDDEKIQLAKITKLNEMRWGQYYKYVDEKVFKESSITLLSDGYIGVEKLFISVGMEEHANLLRENRLTGFDNLLLLFHAKIQKPDTEE